MGVPLATPGLYSFLPRVGQSATPGRSRNPLPRGGHFLPLGDYPSASRVANTFRLALSGHGRAERGWARRGKTRHGFFPFGKYRTSKKSLLFLDAMAAKKDPRATVARHQHRPKTSIDVVPFVACANPATCLPAAHGWATLVEYCHRRGCELRRSINYNGPHRERGRWENAS